jgi:hypothetical protein
LVFFVVYVAVASMLVLKLFDRGETEAVLAGAAGVVVCGSMIFLSQVWADYILPFGFWEHFASDAGSSGNSAPAIAFIGWILLALMGYGILVN